MNLIINLFRFSSIEHHSEVNKWGLWDLSQDGGESWKDKWLKLCCLEWYNSMAWMPDRKMHLIFFKSIPHTYNNA